MKKCCILTPYEEVFNLQVAMVFKTPAYRNGAKQTIDRTVRLELRRQSDLVVSEPMLFSYKASEG